jgi:hypothetical protein
LLPYLFLAFFLDKSVRQEWSPFRRCVLVWRSVVQVYEIRVLCKGRGYTHIEMQYLNDSCAIRAAEVLASGRPFEVWRDLECIHGASRATEPLSSFTAIATQ